jgi:putative GTP pyrophosphokinase
VVYDGCCLRRLGVARRKCHNLSLQKLVSHKMSKARKRKKLSEPTEVSSREAKYLTTAQLAEIGRTYHRKLGGYKALLEEVVFILHDKIAAANIKIHGIENRLKSLASIEGKCRNKNIVNIEELVDVAGVRVICLFRSDMSKVGDLIHSNFDVLNVDDKISTDGPLGYMSVHYVCKIPDRYTGSRYENTRNLQFEIQVRTLCMHAWAAVSHYLDYKGEWDVPEELKRALSALGGLFYVADTEFEQFYAARLASRLEAEKTPIQEEDQEINLDTMTSFLAQMFPDRSHSDSSAISDLIQEIKQGGYASIKEVRNDIVRGQEAFNAYEETIPPKPGPRFADVGVVRITLRIVSPKMREIERKELKAIAASPVDYTSFERLIHPKTAN